MNVMQRRQFLAGLAGTAVVAPAIVRADVAPVIGFLYPGGAAVAPSRIAALREGMRSVGYGEAAKAEILVRASEGDPGKLAPLAAELVARKVDILVPVAPPAVRAAQAATKTIPIVANDLESDPVRSGYVQSLARPGGNVTGVFSDFPAFSTKWVELLKDAVPGLRRIAILWDPSTGAIQREAVADATRLFGLTQEAYEVRALSELGRVFAAVAEQRPDAVVILSSPIFGTNPALIADTALQHRLPSVTLFPDIARAGGLLAYGPNLLGTFQLTGTMVGRVLQGARVAELPVQRPTTFEMVINLRTAKALGVTVPQAMLLLANEVVE
jgi:putative ABC transport system substrate-binding protein